MVYIRLNWNLIEKQISMNSLNCCVRIEGWEKTHLRTWLSRTWSRNFKSVKQCHGWNFHSSVSTFSLHHIYSSFFYCKTLNLYRQSLTKLAKQRTETQLLIWCQYVSSIWYPRGIRLTCTVVVLIEDHSAWRQCLECAVGWVWDTLPYPELKGSGGSDWRQSSIHVSISPEI